MSKEQPPLHRKEEVKQMTVTVHTCPDDTDETLADDNSRLSLEERMALLNEFTTKFMELAGPDFQPLSDYAMSRESIYEDHPKL